MDRRRHLLLIVMSLTLVTACWESHWEDVSQEASHSALLGKQFRPKRTLEVLGITRDPYYKPPVDYYFIPIPPGFAGPEVLERRTLSGNVLLEVVGVRRCTNCWGWGAEATTELEVLLSPGDVYEGTPVYADQRIVLGDEFLEPVPSQ